MKNKKENLRNIPDNSKPLKSLAHMHTFQVLFISQVLFMQ